MKLIAVTAFLVSLFFAAPASAGSCSVYGITIDEATSLYHNRQLRATQRDKGAVPPGTKLCIVGKHRAGNPAFPDFMVWYYQVNFRGKIGWTSEFNLKDRKVHQTQGAETAVAEMEATRQAQKARDQRIFQARKSQIHRRCLEAVKRVAVSSNTVRFSNYWESEWPGHPNGVIAKAAVTARNAFNAPITKRVECMIDDNGFDFNLY